MQPGRPRAAPLRWIVLLLELSKAKITFAVTFSVATGYILFSQRLEVEMLVPMLGTFLLACGSAAINQVQEWRTDTKMPRTRNRPIPSGRITPSWAMFIACAFIAGGLNVLAAVEHHQLVVLGLGLFSLLYYNVVYWALKRLTAFAVVPGALIGAVPPLIGWSAAGGVLLDPLILQVAVFFFIWQVPHFWLLLHMYGDEYTQAGLPSPTAMWTKEQFRRITFAWIIPTAGAGIVAAVMFQLHQPWSLLVLCGSVWITLEALGYLRRTPTPATGRALFHRLNLYALSMMIFLMANALTS